MSVSPHPYKSERTDIFVGIESEQKSEAEVTRYPGFLTGSQQVADPEIEWIEERVVGGDREVFQHVEGPRSFDGGNWTVVPFDGWPIAWLLGSETVNTSTTDVEPKMDGVNPDATSVDGYIEGTPDWRTDLYAGDATLMTHKESIRLFKKLGVKMTPELKAPSVDMPFQGDYTQEDYAQQMIDQYKQAGVDPSRVFPQSFGAPGDRQKGKWCKSTPVKV